MSTLLEKVKDLQMYKRLLYVFGKYSDDFPMTGVDTMLNAMLTLGKKVMPTDARALEILDKTCTDEESVAAKTQRFLNIRFASLDLLVRPMYKDGNSKKVAFWSVNDKVSDMVKSLVDFEGGKGSSGFWCDQDGNKVSLIAID